MVELSEGEDFEGDEEEMIPTIMKPYLKVKIDDQVFYDLLSDKVDLERITLNKK